MFNRYMCKILFIVFVSLLSIYVGASGDDINNLLPYMEGVTVEDEQYVRYGREDWSGPEDLSFRYEILIRNNGLFLHVEVNDDVVIQKDGDTIVSDHVELWLADPVLTAAIRNKMVLLREELGYIDEYEPYDDYEIDNIKDTKTDVQDFIESMKKESGGVQLVFNKTSALLLPNNFPTGNYDKSSIQFQYYPRDDGYEFVALIPIYGLLSFSAYKVDKVGFLVDVVDIDNEDAKEQESLMSASKTRQYGNTDTYVNMELDTPILINVPIEEKIYSDLYSDGYFKFKESRYHYLMALDYMYEISGTGRGQSIENVDYSQVDFREHIPVMGSGEGLEFYTYEEKLAVRSGTHYSIIELAELVDCTVYYDYNILHVSRAIVPDSENDTETFILLVVEGGSYPVPGGGLCGNGRESNVIWLHLDENLHPVDIKSHLIYSCYLNKDLETIMFAQSESHPMKGERGSQKLSADLLCVCTDFGLSCDAYKDALSTNCINNDCYEYGMHYCWQRYYGEENDTNVPATIEIQFSWPDYSDEKRETVTTTLFYDPLEPEKGIREESVKERKSKSN